MQALLLLDGLVRISTTKYISVIYVMLWPVVSISKHAPFRLRSTWPSHHAILHWAATPYNLGALPAVSTITAAMAVCGALHGLQGIDSYRPTTWRRQTAIAVPVPAPLHVAAPIPGAFLPPRAQLNGHVPRGTSCESPASWGWGSGPRSPFEK